MYINILFLIAVVSAWLWNVRARAHLGRGALRHYFVFTYRYTEYCIFVHNFAVECVVNAFDCVVP